MLEYNASFLSQVYSQASGKPGDPQRLLRLALDRFRQARIRAWFGKIWALWAGRSFGWLRTGSFGWPKTDSSGRLLHLGAVRASRPLHNSHYAGVRPVPIRQIRGSEGRRDDFDASFRPLNSHARDRWLSVATAWQKGVALPPVDLIQVGDLYFVRDGHHRISVARAWGAESIDAEVTVWELAGTANRERPAAACELAVRPA
jgi:hypothetical protein